MIGPGLGCFSSRFSTELASLANRPRSCWGLHLRILLLLLMIRIRTFRFLRVVLQILQASWTSILEGFFDLRTVELPFPDPVFFISFFDEKWFEIPEALSTAGSKHSRVHLLPRRHKH